MKQDANIVIMLYRDEYYQNDTDRGIAEVIITNAMANRYREVII